MKKKKNSAAQSLAALRWQNVTAEDRSAHAAVMGKASAVKLTAEQRAARAKKAAMARKK